MTVLTSLLLLAAFEQALPLGAAAGMQAGTAYSDWLASLTHNPALATTAPCRAMATGYWRPHGLTGVDQAGIIGALGRGRGSVVVGLEQLGFDRYRERMFSLAGAFQPRPGLAVGAAGNLLTVTTGPTATELVFALDAGLSLDIGPIRLAGAAARFNRPRFANGDELPARFRLGLATEPLPDLAVAIDGSFIGADPQLALGLDLRLLPQLALRCGTRYPPLGYAAGLGLTTGPVRVEYAVQYHARLRDSHILGLGLSCW